MQYRNRETHWGYFDTKAAKHHEEWVFEPTKRVIETAQENSPAYKELLVRSTVHCRACCCIHDHVELSILLAHVLQALCTLPYAFLQYQLEFGNSRFGAQRVFRMHPCWLIFLVLVLVSAFGYGCYISVITFLERRRCVVLSCLDVLVATDDRRQWCRDLSLRSTALCCRDALQIPYSVLAIARVCSSFES